MSWIVLQEEAETSSCYVSRWENLFQDYIEKWGSTKNGLSGCTARPYGGIIIHFSSGCDVRFSHSTTVLVIHHSHDLASLLISCLSTYQFSFLYSPLLPLSSASALSLSSSDSIYLLYRAHFQLHDKERICLGTRVDLLVHRIAGAPARQSARIKVSPQEMAQGLSATAKVTGLYRTKHKPICLKKNFELGRFFGWLIWNKYKSSFMY